MVNDHAYGTVLVHPLQVCSASPLRAGTSSARPAFGGVGVLAIRVNAIPSLRIYTFGRTPLGPLFPFALVLLIVRLVVVVISRYVRLCTSLTLA